eukprot:gene20054-22021_t
MALRLAARRCTRCLGLWNNKQVLHSRILPTFINVINLAKFQSNAGSASETPTKPRKAPLSAYQIFMKERLSNKSPVSGPQTDMLRKAAVEWQSLSEDEKSPYYERSDIEKDSWYKECANYESYLDSLSEVQRRRIQLKELMLKADAKERRKLSKTAPDDALLKMPKRPGSTFQMFITQELQKGEFKGLKGPQLFHAAGEKWRNLPESQKDELKVQKRHLQEKYIEELEAWKNS